MEEEKPRRHSSVRGAPPGAMNRTAFGVLVDMAPFSLRRWEKRGILTPKYVFGVSKVTGRSYSRPFYLPADVETFKERRFWRSGAGTRAAKTTLKGRKR
jgi:hypothetical protein